MYPQPPPSNTRPAGYSRLLEEFQVRALPHDIEVYVANTHSRSQQVVDGRTRRIVPAPQWPGDDTYSHLKFALRYEGLHLGILRAVLPRLDPVELAAQIRAEPTGAYARRIWFLTESFTGTPLDLPDLTMGNYTPLADPEAVYTGTIRRSARHRVAMNLLGDLDFCFLLRRTTELAHADAQRFDITCEKLMQEVPPEIFQRTLDYLYSKETRSSFAIEHETPDQKRAANFVRLLQQSNSQDYLQRDALVTLQNAIVDSRFANTGGWRDTVQPPEQNFLAGARAPNFEGIHFIPPRPQEINALMTGWLRASRLALESEAPPVVVAAAIAWAFVFLHPFTDGNGRIHRFLIHHVLARRGFAPRGLVFPVSASMLEDHCAYDTSLETFSKPLLPLLEWQMDDNRRLRVLHDSSDLYRFIDYTAIATALYQFVQRTVERDLPQELTFLRGYDNARSAMHDILELPDPLADRFIQFCKQNGWRLSIAKRNTGGLEKLTDSEIAALEAAVRKAFRVSESVEGEH